MKTINSTKTVVFLLVIGICLISASCKPDLTGTISCPGQARPGEELNTNITVVLENKGSKPAQNFFVDLVLSTDTTIPVSFATFSPNFSEDVLLESGRENVDELGAKTSLNLVLNGVNKIPDDTPPGNYYIGFVVDPGKTINESNEGNNTGVCPIQIVACDPIADITNCQILEASGGTVGYVRLKLGWNYGAGERPNALLITVYRSSAGAWDNIMPGEDPFNVPSPETTTVSDVIIFRLFSGDYKIVFDASYSCEREKQFSFERHI